ncbi:hypothetical protein AM1_E0157 (plasmid) [Acaryochloris marina MBIC11017]|uniref:Uncharacterized protein n=2 Tax=Acaryochloris marina TaxID=155978 RepID=A8ZPJ0_ACAM1|nr:hypothetical protein AM1_E0157 [Acaryochloris marina MBIC11017]
MVFDHHTLPHPIILMDADFDLDSLYQQLQDEDVIELTILDGDLAPGQTAEITVASKWLTRYHLYLFFEHHSQSFDLAGVKEGASKTKVNLIIDHMDAISSEKAYIFTYGSETSWSIQLVQWKKLTRA